jgi:excisionase family DNA binding protein
MAQPALTLDPGLLDAPDDGVWISALVDYVRRAARAGETVVVSAQARLMSTEEVARGLNVSRSTVSRRIAAGQIQSVKAGNRHRVPYQEFRRLWEESMGRFAEASASDLAAELFGNG